jgi:hypothetical protein
MENENQPKGIEEMIFKVLPEGKVERQLVSPFNDSQSRVEEQKTGIGFHPKRSDKEVASDDDEFYF